MRPISVSIDVPQNREAVHAFLDVLAHHELFTDHMLRDWACSGPPAGVGAQAEVINVLAGQRVPVTIEVVAAVHGESTTERNVSAGGRRVGQGTYNLADLADGGTRVTFTYAWVRAPLEDRLLAPIVRPVMRRAFRRALERLADEVTRRSPADSAIAAARAPRPAKVVLLGLDAPHAPR